ncbi:MAG: FtsQ-type POTRA domain-containing protein [Gemmatimonadetes bacterium]|nr:FtsQ-type POTRA domain-containing protein [Gemmatimonadota bacterium]MCA9763605.1 FtsQ-type POTRA domain-containing protein [Gemmatimonadota bacterium]HPF62605.1 FtsQ-type POTRA domain-containing protein [Gemmatimonadales bacterium]HRX18402.1 FtsQ-type POTRA domain-containing protein [Gemmatimonadales bacterium]
MTPRRLGIWALAVVGLSAGLVIAVPALVSRLAFFRIRMVEIVGATYLDPLDIVPRLAVPEGADILLDLGPIRDAALEIPGIREAEVSRRWPGTLVVTIREAVPVALVSVEGDLMVMDVSGEVLPWSPARIDHSLPLAPNDSAVAGLLGRLRSADPQWYATVDRAVRRGPDLWLEAGGRSVRLMPTASEGVLRNLELVRQWLADSAIAWREIDARVPTRFFVLKAAS